MSEINLSKKGLTSTVSLVVIILISSILASSLALFLTNFASTSLSPASCTFSSISNPIQIKKAYFNKDSSELEITLARAPNTKEVREFSLEYGSEQTKNYEFCSDSCSSCVILKEGETKTYKIYIADSKKPQFLHLTVNNCAIQDLNSADIEG